MYARKSRTRQPFALGGECLAGDIDTRREGRNAPLNKEALMTRPPATRATIAPDPPSILPRLGGNGLPPPLPLPPLPPPPPPPYAIPAALARSASTLPNVRAPEPDMVCDAAVGSVELK